MTATAIRARRQASRVGDRSPSICRNGPEQIFTGPTNLASGELREINLEISMAITATSQHARISVAAYPRHLRRGQAHSKKRLRASWRDRGNGGRSGQPAA